MNCAICGNKMEFVMAYLVNVSEHCLKITYETNNLYQCPECGKIDRSAV